MEEMWEDIKDYPNYQISSSGKVWSKNHNRLLNPSILRSGYKAIRLSTNGWQRDYLVHRLVAEAFVPNDFNKPVVNHKDGVKTNNYWLNLEYVTDSENQLHAIRTGLKLVKSKEDHPMSKLLQSEVDKIRELSYNGVTYKQIASEFGVHYSTIGRIINKETWK